MNIEIIVWSDGRAEAVTTIGQKTFTAFSHVSVADAVTYLIKIIDQSGTPRPRTPMEKR